MTQPAFWNRLADRYAARPVSDPDGYARTLDASRRTLRPTDSVLEMGCGTGTTALALADAAARITATDYAEAMIAIARRKATEAGADTVSFEVADDRLADMPDAAFDAVLAFNLLHLLPDLPATLARVHAVLKPGGHIISKTACLGGSLLLPAVIGLMRLAGRAPHVSMLRPADLHAQIEAAGFEIVETAEHNKGTRGHFIVARRR